MVSLSLACESNEVVAIDLKEWKPNVYFLHMIHLATKFSLASVIRRNNDNVDRKWNRSSKALPS